jgi:hypothetical protein
MWLALDDDCLPIKSADRRVPHLSRRYRVILSHYPRLRTPFEVLLGISDRGWGRLARRDDAGRRELRRLAPLGRTNWPHHRRHWPTTQVVDDQRHCRRGDSLPCCRRRVAWTQCAPAHSRRRRNAFALSRNRTRQASAMRGSAAAQTGSRPPRPSTYVARRSTSSPDAGFASPDFRPLRLQILGQQRAPVSGPLAHLLKSARPGSHQCPRIGRGGKSNSVAATCPRPG